MGASPSLTACPLIQAVLLPLLRVTKPDSDIKVGRGAWSVGAFLLATMASRSLALKKSVPTAPGTCAKQFPATKLTLASAHRPQCRPQGRLLSGDINSLGVVRVLAIMVFGQRMLASEVG